MRSVPPRAQKRSSAECRRSSTVAFAAGMFWSPTAFEARRFASHRARGDLRPGGDSSFASRPKPTRSRWPTTATTDLPASVWTNNLGRANRVARAIRSGYGSDQHALRGLSRACRSAATSSPDTDASLAWKRCVSTAKPRACSPTSGRNRWIRSGYSGSVWTNRSRSANTTTRRTERFGKTERTFRAVPSDASSAARRPRFLRSLSNRTRRRAAGNVGGLERD